MPRMSLIPVDHEPEFGGGYSLVPIDHNPFSADAMIGQARTELAGQPKRLREPELSPQDQAAMMPETYANPYVRGLIDSTASLPRRAIESSQYSLDSGNYDPGPTLEAAMLPMGTGAIAGVPVRAGETALGAGPIRAYHGSPHDFDKFDLSKIGTGEGAQAYGHGLYFAENEKVAKGYRDALAGKSMRMSDGSPIDPNTSVDVIRNNILAAHPDFGQPTQAAQWVFNRLHAGKTADEIARDIGGMAWGDVQKDAVRTALKATEGWKTNPKMYEVNINADPAHFLDWDKGLNQHAPQTQDAIKRAMSIDYYGKPDPSKAERIWSQFGGAKTGTAVKQGFIASDDKLVANRLHEAGIPGIKYLDQGSRTAGEGSRNFVVFNDKLIDIVRKYAAAGIALPPAIAAEYSRQFKPVDHDPFAPMPPPGNYTAGLGMHS